MCYNRFGMCRFSYPMPKSMERDFDDVDLNNSTVEQTAGEGNNASYVKSVIKFFERKDNFATRSPNGLSHRTTKTTTPIAATPTDPLMTTGDVAATISGSNQNEDMSIADERCEDDSRQVDASEHGRIIDESIEGRETVFQESDINGSYSGDPVVIHRPEGYAVGALRLPEEEKPETIDALRHIVEDIIPSHIVSAATDAAELEDTTGGLHYDTEGMNFEGTESASDRISHNQVSRNC